MVGAEIFRSDIGKDEVFGRYRTAGEATQECELTGVGHGVGKRTLEKNLGSDAAKLGAEFEVNGDVSENLVEVLDRGGEVREDRRLVRAADKERA